MSDSTRASDAHRARQLVTEAINRSQIGDDAAAREKMREVGQFVEGFCDEEVSFE
jgi:hypothetical protein